MAKYRINHTHLTTDNPQRLLDFYTGVMGGKMVQEVMLQGNNIILYRRMGLHERQL